MLVPSMFRSTTVYTKNLRYGTKVVHGRFPLRSKSASAEGMPSSAKVVSENHFKPEWFVSSSERTSFFEGLKRYGVRLEEDNDLLSALCDPAKIETLGHEVTAITIKSNLAKPFEYPLASHTLYQRYWYEDLLTSINQRSKRSVVLIGSAGSSKSTWQFWYLYRVLQSIHDGKPWPTKPFKRWTYPDPPEVIIREVCDDQSLTFYLMREKKVYSGIVGPPSDLLQHFSPSKVMLLYEAGSKDNTPIVKYDCPTIATVSPDFSRYKEIRKDAAELRYQMMYSLNELLAIGAHMRPSLEGGHKTLHELFAPELITDRFDQYGGSMHRVLPNSVIDSEVDHSRFAEALWDMSFLPGVSRLPLFIGSDVTTFLAGSDYLVHWLPAVAFDEKDANQYSITDFTKSQRQLASLQVEEMVKQKLFEVEFATVKRELHNTLTEKKLLFTVNNKDMVPSLLENYGVRYLVETFDDIIAMGRSSSSSKFLPVVVEIKREAPTSYKDMQKGVLYYPVKHKKRRRSVVPVCCDAYFKVTSEDGDDDLLYLLHVSTLHADQVCLNSALAKWLGEMEFPPERMSKLRMLYFRLNDTSHWRLQLDDDDDDEPNGYEEWIKKYQLADDVESANTIERIKKGVTYFTLDVVEVVDRVKTWPFEITTSSQQQQERSHDDCENCDEKSNDDDADDDENEDGDSDDDANEEN